MSPAEGALELIHVLFNVTIYRTTCAHHAYADYKHSAAGSERRAREEKSASGDEDALFYAWLKVVLTC